MTSERQVRLRLEHRTISDAACNPRDALSYPGITIERVENDDVVEQTWIPLGTAPDYADDEALIAAWHAAVQWSRSYTDSHPT
ncbi:hypothetical protein [Amycolatopsis sp. NPDC098790]|uniref:hypothetical protein n=1 Tax=Amycolatopsis sp. NPDC098790 TaxID=3363939 RepID=UPI003814D07C